MRILLWHGWLLTGSGSNIFTAQLARAWRRAGHDVLLLCQETAAVPFVDASGDFDDANGTVEFSPTDAQAEKGRCRLARPNIGDLLPVFVGDDDYPGFRARRFVDLTDKELKEYAEHNERALRTAVELHDPVAVITGHEVMGPAIARAALEKSRRSYLAKLHGSGLEYAVKKQERYRRHAEVGLMGAAVVTGGSRYMIREAARVVPGWEDRAAVVNPGCDADLFRPRKRRNGPPHVGYVGKFLTAKGVHNLVCALGASRTADLRVTIVGYGGFDSALRSLARALAEGDLDAARTLLGHEDPSHVQPALDFLSSVDPRALARRFSEIDVRFPGRLDHGPLARVLPDFDLLVVPSVVPEAFGMVAAEAAAAGVLPIVPNHSGIAEAGEALERALDRPGLLTFDAATPIDGIAEKIDALLALERAERRRMAEEIAAFARERWDWGSVADRLLTLAARGYGEDIASLGDS